MTATRRATAVPVPVTVTVPMTLTMAFTVALAVLLTGLTGCTRPAAPPPADESSQWHRAQSASGNYSVELRGKEAVATQPIPDTELQTQTVGSQFGDLSFVVSETALKNTANWSLDGAVDGSVEGARAQMPSSSKPATVKPVAKVKLQIAGADARRFIFELHGDKTARVDSLLFLRNGTVVQAVLTNSAPPDQHSADRFLSSLQPTR